MWLKEMSESDATHTNEGADGPGTQPRTQRKSQVLERRWGERSPAAWGRGRSVFTCHQRVVTCPKAPQASEQQSRGSNPEPMKAVPKHMRVNRRATPEGPAQGTALLSPCLPEQLAQGWQCQHLFFPNRAPFSLTATATHPLTPTSLLIKSLFFFYWPYPMACRTSPRWASKPRALL